MSFLIMKSGDYCKLTRHIANIFRFAEFNLLQLTDLKQFAYISFSGNYSDLSISKATFRVIHNQTNRADIPIALPQNW